MSAFNAAGNKDVRQYLQNNWNWVGLVDDTGSVMTYIDILNDSRATITSDYTSNPITIEIEVQGGDSDITTPVTFTESRSYKSDGATTSMAPDPFLNATLQGSGDTLTLTHTVKVPQ